MSNLTPKACDVVFRVEKRDIPYFKARLEDQSPVFATMFSANWVEGASSAEKPIELREKKYDEMVALFGVLAPGGDRVVTAANVQRLLELADEYELQSVTSACEKFLALSAHAISIEVYIVELELACKYGLRGALDVLANSVSRFNLVTFAIPLLELASDYEPKLRSVRDAVEAKLACHWHNWRPKYRNINLPLPDIVKIADKFKLTNLMAALMPIVARHLSASKLRELEPDISDLFHRSLVATRLLFQRMADAELVASDAEDGNAASDDES